MISHIKVLASLYFIMYGRKPSKRMAMFFNTFWFDKRRRQCQ